MVEAFTRWVNTHNVSVLNVAGPRESTSSGISRQAEAFLIKALTLQSVDDSEEL